MGFSLINLLNFKIIQQECTSSGRVSDPRKVFDLVDHNILFLKLEEYGLRGEALNWFKSYLKDRVQYVMVKGSLSEFYTLLNIAVPQGFILGPTLFLIYFNDLFNCNNGFNILFADDTTSLAKGKNIEDLSKSYKY